MSMAMSKEIVIDREEEVAIIRETAGGSGSGREG